MKKAKKTRDEGLKEFYKVLGLTATIEILYSISEGNNQYKHFLRFTSSGIINERMRQLISLKIIEHNFTRDGERKEWYSLTEKGVKILEVVEELKSVFLDDQKNASSPKG